MSLDPALVLSIFSTVLAGAAHARFHLKSRCCGQVISLDLTPKSDSPLIGSLPQNPHAAAPADSDNKKCSDPSPSSGAAKPLSNVTVA